jgi:alkylation response protein AidB-like acyl-CoA dehydrogenase
VHADTLRGLTRVPRVTSQPVLHFGSLALQDKVAPACLAGDKFICLCITEPLAGSDVAAIRTTAVKDPTGKARLLRASLLARAC